MNLTIEQKEIKGQSFETIIPVNTVLENIVDTMPVLDYKAKIELGNKLCDVKTQYKILAIDHIINASVKAGYPLVSINNGRYAWNGAYYAAISDEMLAEFLREAALKSGMQMYLISDVNYIKKMMEQFKYVTKKHIYKNTGKKIMINLLNGTMEFNEAGYSLRPHRQEDLLTYVLDFNYNEDARAPIWESHLNKVLPGCSEQMVLAEHFSYAFIPTSKLKLEKVLVLLGDGGNGKSVVHDVMSKLFGSYNITHNSLENLCRHDGYYRSKLDQFLLNYCSELSDKMNIANFKKLASGEDIDARDPYGQVRMISDYAKLIFNTNHLPTNIEQNTAFFRRLNVLEFNVTIPEAEQDRDLANKIALSELPGVLNWILAGLSRLIENKKFTRCDSSVEHIEQYKTEANSVQLFVNDEGFVNDEEEKRPVANLFASYVQYCKSNRYPILAKNIFSRRLKKLGFNFNRDSRRSYIYIRQELANVSQNI